MKKTLMTLCMLSTFGAISASAFDIQGAGTYSCKVTCRNGSTETYKGLTAVGCAKKGETFCSNRGGLAANSPQMTPEATAPVGVSQ